MAFQSVHAQQYRTPIMPALAIQDVEYTHNHLYLRVFHVNPDVPLFFLRDAFKNKLCKDMQKRKSSRYVYRRPY